MSTQTTHNLNGIQQVGIGCSDAQQTFAWYRKMLGFDIRVFADEADAKLMTRYTGGAVQSRYAILAMNMQGGGGLEIWQYTSRTPEGTAAPVQIGDLGINTVKIRTASTDKAYASISKESTCSVEPIRTDSLGRKSFYFRDPWSNQVELIEDGHCFVNTGATAGGVMGVTIGVSDMKASLVFYREVMGYEEVAAESTSAGAEIGDHARSTEQYKRVILRPTNPGKGGFAPLLGPTEVELVQAMDHTSSQSFAGRYWGDLGYIHVCFDVAGMELLKTHCADRGHAFTVDSSTSFDMGDAAGHFGYIEDPDGTLIEFVETHRVPIIKKLGISIDLKKRGQDRPLPNWIIKSMRIHRVKD